MVVAFRKKGRRDLIKVAVELSLKQEVERWNGTVPDPTDLRCVKVRIGRQKNLIRRHLCFRKTANRYGTATLRIFQSDSVSEVVVLVPTPHVASFWEMRVQGLPGEGTIRVALKSHNDARSVNEGQAHLKPQVNQLSIAKSSSYHTGSPNHLNRRSDTANMSS